MARCIEYRIWGHLDLVVLEPTLHKPVAQEIKDIDSQRLLAAGREFQKACRILRTYVHRIRV